MTSTRSHGRRWRLVPLLALGLVVSLFPVTGRAAGCSVGATGVAFGVYDPLSAGPIDATGTVTVSCVWTSSGGPGVQSVRPVISLSAGFAPGTYAQRVLRTLVGDRLNYNLYRNTARTQVWGDGSAGTVTARTSPSTLSLPPSGTPVIGRRTIYGRLAAGQSTAVPGSYSDTITVTVTF